MFQSLTGWSILTQTQGQSSDRRSSTEPDPGSVRLVRGRQIEQDVYYERIDYRCGDFKWGNMKLRCERQPRMGETCGAKLADTENLQRRDQDCRICEDIQTKTRRYKKELDNVARWKSDRRGGFQASIEKATKESDNLRDQIRDLNSRRPSVRFGPR